MACCICKSGLGYEQTSQPPEPHHFQLIFTTSTPLLTAQRQLLDKRRVGIAARHVDEFDISDPDHAPVDAAGRADNTCDMGGVIADRLGG